MIARPLYIRRRFYRPWGAGLYRRPLLWRPFWRPFFGCGPLALLSTLCACAMFATFVLSHHL